MFSGAHTRVPAFMDRPTAVGTTITLMPGWMPPSRSTSRSAATSCAQT